MSNFTIIKNSESHTGYDIADVEYAGLIDGLVCGWQFEFQNAAGEIGYNSVEYDYRDPDELVKQRGERGFELERMNGWTPTGRVIFRGYGVEMYDSEERDWYVVPVEV